jgi:hypothetical protein
MCMVSTSCDSHSLEGAVLLFIGPPQTCHTPSAQVFSSLAGYLESWLTVGNYRLRLYFLRVVSAFFLLLPLQ